MSLLNTESWMMFARWDGDDADSTANNAARLAASNALKAAGYEVYSQLTTAGWIIRRHPIFADRNALVFSSPSGSSTQYAVRKKVGTPGQTVVGGFSLFVPTAYKPDTANTYGGGPYPTLVIRATANGAVMNAMQSNPNLVQDELFRIRYDLLTAYGLESQSSKYVPQGKLVYFEYRITPTEFRVWMDDTLILQKSIAMNPSNILFGIMAWPSGAPTISAVANADGRWAIADWYNLVEDAVKPNVRLGASTRVIGTLPASDVSAQFVRPSGFASNAAVVAQPLDPASTSFLKTDTVGAKDLYTGVANSEVATASLIHAMNVKVVAQNLESTAHAIRPLVSSAGVEGGADVPLLPTLAVASYASTVDPATGQDWTATAAANAKFGMKLSS